MNLHEYQAKALFAEYGLPVSEGYACDTPQEAVEAKRKWPRVMEQFQQSELGKSLTGVRRQPEWLIRMHAAVWEYYGNRLFELFDLRHPELWDEYTQFTKEFYVIKGLSPNISPPQNQIC